MTTEMIDNDCCDSFM